MKNTRRTRNITLSAAFLALASGVTVGCASEPEQQVYCADADYRVLPEEECEDNDNIGFIYIGTYSSDHQRVYEVAEQLPKNQTTKVVKSNNSSARTSAGLPARGGFGGNGATISSSSGG